MGNKHNQKSQGRESFISQESIRYKSPYLDNIWESAVKKNYRVFYFKPDNEHIRVKDISSLDLFEDEEIAEWGGLTSFATRASEVVSDVVSETEKIEETEKRG